MKLCRAQKTQELYKEMEEQENPNEFVQDRKYIKFVEGTEEQENPDREDLEIVEGK